MATPGNALGFKTTRQKALIFAMPTDTHRPDYPRDDDHPYTRPPDPPRPEGSTGRSIFFAVAVVAVHLLATAFATVGLMIFGIRCEKVFRDFNMKPDDLTEVALAVSRW